MNEKRAQVVECVCDNCGHVFLFKDGVPENNGSRFCCQCGSASVRLKE